MSKVKGINTVSRRKLSPSAIGAQARCRVVTRPRGEGQDHGGLGPGREGERERERERDYINIYKTLTTRLGACLAEPN